MLNEHSEQKLPEINVTRQVREVTEDCLKILAANNDPPSVFETEGILTRVDAHDGDAQIVPLGRDWLLARLTRLADFLKVTKTGIAEVPPPTIVLRDILVRGWGAGNQKVLSPFPLLKAISTRPFLRPDGTVCDQPGYDAATRRFLVLPEGF